MSKQYRALVGLTVPVDAKEDARIRKANEAGAPIPHEERRMAEVAVGDVAAYIPEKSLPWLLEQGLIEEVT